MTENSQDTVCVLVIDTGDERAARLVLADPKLSAADWIVRPLSATGELPATKYLAFAALPREATERWAGEHGVAAEGQPTIGVATYAGERPLPADGTRDRCLGFSAGGTVAELGLKVVRAG
jgi:hypothetical protein